MNNDRILSRLENSTSKKAPMFSHIRMTIDLKKKAVLN